MEKENEHTRNKLLNKNVIIDIISGYGFGLIKGYIVIHATLMNIKYKTHDIPVNTNNIKIDSKVCWSLDNNMLRNLKMANTGIRVDCFNIPQSNTNSYEKLGYILLKIKEAQTIDPTSNDRIEYNSYKLLGSTNCIYNITLSFRLEDYIDETIETTPKKRNLKLSNNENLSDNNNLKKEENGEKDSPKINVNNLDQNESILENKQQNVLNNDMLQKSNEKLEKELTQAMEKCKKLVENLENMAVTLKEREVVLKAKELEVAQEMAKCENMTDILKEREAVVRAKELKLVNQKNSIDNNAQISELKNNNDINSNNNLQIQQLENTILILRNNLEEAKKSIITYKERWIIWEKKFNQMK